MIAGYFQFLGSAGLWYNFYTAHYSTNALLRWITGKMGMTVVTIE